MFIWFYLVKQYHREYLRAGSDVMQAYTFYASDNKLQLVQKQLGTKIEATVLFSFYFINNNKNNSVFLYIAFPYSYLKCFTHYYTPNRSVSVYKIMIIILFCFNVHCGTYSPNGCILYMLRVLSSTLQAHLLPATKCNHLVWVNCLTIGSNLW